MHRRKNVLIARLFSTGWKTQKFWLTLALALSVASAQAQLGGTKTVGSGGDYPTLAAAVADLNSQGVGGGGVTFNLLSGNYNEHVEITASGTAANPIIFQSQSGIATDVTIYFNATASDSNYVIKLTGADHVTFQNLSFTALGSSYGRIFYLLNNADDNKIKNNILTGYNTTTSSANHSLIYSYLTSEDRIEISGNTFSMGGWGVDMTGVSNASQSTGNRVLNNNFTTGYGGVYLAYQDSPYINGNTIRSKSRGVECYDCNDSLQIQKNRIGLDSPSYGIYLYACDGSQFGGKGLIANNAIDIGGVSYAYGLYLESSSYINVYYNSVWLHNVNASNGIAFYPNNGNNINVQNNIFANYGVGYAYYCNTPAAVATSNYNDLYSNGNFLGFWSGDRRDLAAFQAASGKETNSISIFPEFVSDTNLHQTSPWIDSAATPVAGAFGATDDIDGEARDASKPDMGCDEFVAAPSSLVPLSGTYSIGPVSSIAAPNANYPTINAAVADLVLRGVSAPVTFEIQSGNYNEQINLVSIPGTSASNTVTFQSQTGNRDDVVLYFSATGTANNYLVKFNGAKHVTFQKLSFNAIGASYATVFNLFGGLDNVKILNNLLVGLNTTSSSANLSLIYGNNVYSSNLQINGNTFSQGGWGVDVAGISNTVQSTGTRVLNDTFLTGYGGSYLQFQDSPYINGNVISSRNRGIECYDCDDSLQIQKNKIALTTSSYGIYLYVCNGTQFGGRGLIANNFVQIGGNSTAYGLYLESCEYQNVYYNSIFITSTYEAGGIAFYPNNGNNINSQNNIFANRGGGYALYVNTPGALATSNYNDYYTNGNFLAYWTANRKDLAALQAASSKDANSIFILPQFVSDTDLHQSSPWIDSAGSPVAGSFGVTQDIDGEARDASKPDIGADEFIANPSTLIPLSGTYTIGTTLTTSPNANYTTLNAAAADLMLKGVSGPVTFNIQSGNYNERINLYSVPGASNANPITFQSGTGNRADVTIYNSASSTGDNYLVKLNGADFITFQNLTFNAQGTSYATVFNLYGGVDNAKISNNLLVGYNTTSSSANYSLIYGYQVYTSNIEVSGNTFSQGGWGVDLASYNNSFQGSGTRVLNDTFLTGYGGVYLQYQDSPYINYNKVDADHRGIELYDCNDSLQVLKNKISVTSSGYGIYLYICDGSEFGGKGLIANNFVQVGSNSTAYGLYLESSTYQNVYYNSVNITSTYVQGSIGCYPNYGGNLNLVNNIFSAPGGGYAYYVNTPGAITTSNYNDFYTTGSNLAYWSGNRSDLISLQSASGKDINSVSVNPKFTSASDLHVLQVLLDSTGTPLALVTDDIDGESRDANYPDMGADEFACTAMPGDANASGTYTLADIIAAVNYYFNKPGCSPAPLCWLSGLLCRGDWNASGTITLGDIIQGVNYYFNKPGGPWNALPIGECCLAP